LKREELSAAQWGALLWGAALAPAAQLLPGAALEIAGRGAWLSPLAALVVLLPLLWLGQRGDADILKSTRPGKLLLVLAAVWMELLLLLRLALCARRMLRTGERDGGMWYFVLALAALVLWMGQGRLAAFGRAGQLFLVPLLGAAALVLVLSLPTLRPDRILPLWTGDIFPVLRAGVRTAGDLSWAVLPMLLLPARPRGRKSLLLWGIGGCLLLALAQGIVLGNLGVVLARQSPSPFFALTKSVGVEGAFQRVESVVAALWLLADLAICVALLHAIGLSAEGAVPKLKKETAGTFALLAAAGGALWLLSWGADPELWARDWVWLGNLIVGTVTAAGLRGSAPFVKITKEG